MQEDSSQSNFESDDQRGTQDSAMEPLPYCHTASQITTSIAQRAAALGQSRCMRCRKWLPTSEFTTTNCARCHSYNMARSARGRKRTNEQKSVELAEAEEDMEPVNVPVGILDGVQDDVDVPGIVDEQLQGGDEGGEEEEDVNDVEDEDGSNDYGYDSEDGEDDEDEEEDEDEDDDGEVEDYEEGEDGDVFEGDVVGGSHVLENHLAQMDHDYDDESDDGGWDGEEGYFAGWYELCMS